MREIKYKAWHDKWGWADPRDIYVHGDGTYDVDYRGENGDKIECYTEKNKELHLIEYTGLHDKNNKETYKKDMLQIWMEGDKQTKPYIVESLRSFYADLDTNDSYMRITDFEVIGNRFEGVSDAKETV